MLSGEGKLIMYGCIRLNDYGGWDDIVWTNLYNYLIYYIKKMED